MIDWYRFLPPYWLQTGPTNKEWDRALNKALDTGRIEDVDNYTAKVGGITVWVSNWPYGYGNPYEPTVRVLPTVATRKRLRAALINALIPKITEEQPQ